MPLFQPLLEEAQPLIRRDLRRIPEICFGCADVEPVRGGEFPGYKAGHGFWGHLTYFVLLDRVFEALGFYQEAAPVFR
jgi:hypothetical protein